MDAKNLLLGVFVILTVAFASLTLAEYYQVNTLNSKLGQIKITSAQTITSTTTITSTASCPSNAVCGTFTYAPRGQVQVDSVQAMMGGGEDVTFTVTFENIGAGPVYFPSYELNSSISTNSTISREDCNCGLGVSESVTLNHGQNFTLYDPASGDGYFYKLLQGGTVNVTFSFNWATQSSSSTSNTTTVSALFIFEPPS
jgi:hypothetical protein